MRFSRVLNFGLVALTWSVLAVLVAIAGALFVAAVWLGVAPDERLQRFYESRDFQRIEEWARQGSEAAEFWMGRVHQERGQPDDAIEWYRRAATRDDLRAIGRLAALYGEKNHPEERVRWLRRGTELGALGMQLGLAHAYRHGLGVPRDDREAFRLFLGVATIAGGETGLTVARMYAWGDGTDRDPVEALAWAAIAENSLIDSAGHTVPGPVCMLRAELREALSSQQIEQAMQRARALHPGIMGRATERDPCAPRKNP